MYSQGIDNKGMDDITMRELVDKYIEASEIERLKDGMRASDFL